MRIPLVCMSRRIEIELTSHRPDGTWTWRAAGAREPKGVIEASLVPDAVSVNAVLRAEVESDLDGTRVLAIVPPKQKQPRTGLLELLPSDKPFEPVTQRLAKKSDRRPKGKGRPNEGDRERRRDKDERGERPRRPFFEAPPELPQRPRPKRIRAGRKNVDAVLAELPEAHRAIAEKVIGGGVPAVRAAIELQNKTAAQEGREVIPADGLVAMAEQLHGRLRIAEWRDRAEGAEQIIEEIDLRDLRSLVVSADTLVAPDEATRGMIARMKAALVTRQEIETKNWLEDIEAATTIGRIVRALKLSSQPPKAGILFRGPVASKLIQATNEALVADAPPDRWVALLEAAAFSPIRAQVIPASIPQTVVEEVSRTVTRLAPLMPQVAGLFGITADPKAKPPRPLPIVRDRAGQRDRKDGARKPRTRPGANPKAPSTEAQDGATPDGNGA